MSNEQSVNCGIRTFDCGGRFGVRAVFVNQNRQSYGLTTPLE